MPSTIHVLYMEDNEGTARLLQKRLSRSGYCVDVALDGEEGLARIAADPYDVVLIDYKMPTLNGLQVIQRLAQRGELPTIIMLTGTGNEKVAVDALKLGATDYVVKDVDGVYLDLLPTIIEQGLKNRQLLEDKRRAEEALKRSEQYHRALIESSLDLILLTDEKGVISYVSPSIRQIFGVDEQALIGQNGFELVASRGTGPITLDIVADAEDFFSTLLGSPGKLVETEFWVRARNGAQYWLEVRGKNLLHEPWIAAIVFNIRNITERKQAEAALRESEQGFRQLFELAPDPYAICDVDGRFTDCNRATEEIMRERRENLLGKTVADLQSLSLDKYNALMDAFKESAPNNPYFQVEASIRRRDGTEFIADVRVTPVTLKGESRVLGIARDITWRKQIETQMQAHIEQLQTLRNIDNELTYRLDIDYVLTMALDTMLHVSGANAGSIHVIDQERVLQTKVVGYPESAQTSVEQRSIASWPAQQQEPEWVRNVADDPNYLPILPDTVSQITIPLLSQKRLVGILNLETRHADLFSSERFEFLKLIASRVSVAIDNARLYHTTQVQLAELQALYTHLTELEQLKTDMIRVASHDLRNPLAIVALDIYILRRTLGEQLSEQERKYLDQIDSAAKQMQSITTDFLSFDRLNLLGDNEIRSQKTDLGDLVQSTFASFQSQTEQKAQTYQLRIPETPVIVAASRPELQRVIANLIGNAIKYTPDGGTIEVVLCQDEHMVQFEVIDSGYGIPLEQQDKLFQPFSRIQIKEAASIDGTGLGLYLAKRLIERNGGQILFQSEYGKGSTFGFKLFQ